jgi:ribonuclease HI
MRLTRRIICDTIANTGSFNAKQFLLLGIKWPPTTGWIDRLEGFEISDEQWNKFLVAKQKAKIGFLPTIATLNPSCMKIGIIFDGGCKGNPGRKYGSYQILLNGKQIAGRNRVDFGFGTNNEAEFDALQMALDELKGLSVKNGFELARCALLIETDSTVVRNRLMVKNRIFKKYPRSLVMFELANKCLELMRQCLHYEVTWRRREYNVEKFGH